MPERDRRDASNWHAWLKKAENDWLNVTNNLRAGQVPWDTVCFHVHQAVEKMLKAVLVRHGFAPRRTHDLVALLAECANKEPALKSLEADCRRLHSLSIGVRYPDDVSEPSEADAREMLKLGESIRDVLARLLQQL